MANIQAEAELLLGSEHSSQKDSHDGSQVRTSRTSEIVVAVVVPTLNEIDGITGLIPSIKKTLGRYRTEVIVIDGKSSDGTIVRARELGARVLTQQRSGYGDALQLGFRFAYLTTRADITVMIDGDMTYDPEDVLRITEPIASGEADLVVGNRFANIRKGAMSRTNRWGNRILSWFARYAVGIDSQCGLRAFRTRFTPHIIGASNGMAYATEMTAEIIQAGGRVSELPISYSNRIGRSKLKPFRDGLQIFSTTVRLARDYKPLLFFGGTGTALVTLGMLLGINEFSDYLRYGYVLHPPLVVLLALVVISGVQLLSLGLIADMVKSFRREMRHYSQFDQDLELRASPDGIPGRFD